MPKVSAGLRHRPALPPNNSPLIPRPAQSRVRRHPCRRTSRPPALARRSTLRFRLRFARKRVWSAVP